MFTVICDKYEADLIIIIVTGTTSEFMEVLKITIDANTYLQLADVEVMNVHNTIIFFA